MSMTTAKTQHDYAVYLFQQGCYEDALTHLDEILREQESGELWSDWATAQFALSHFSGEVCKNVEDLKRTFF